MVSILHISDLHIIEGAVWNNMRAALLGEAGERTRDRDRGEKLLVVTGDFHNFWDKDYSRAKDFLGRLIRTMDIDPADDVFVIPGNHDVGCDAAMEALFDTDKQWKMRQKSALKEIKEGNREYMQWRMESFLPYCRFVRELGIYSGDDETLPARTHVRTWRGKLHLLHLNTALVADGTSKEKQQTDTDAATDEKVWLSHQQKMLPALVLGHNSFFDLTRDQREQLAAVFDRRMVSAYLCGDQHRSEHDRDRQMIRLKSGLEKTDEIPNIVSMKGAADSHDQYSEFGFYWHTWDEETDEVTLEARRWRRDEEQSEFLPEGKTTCYIMRREGKGNSAAVSERASQPKRKEEDTAERSSLDKLSADKKTVRGAYFDYLSKELGVIQFDGIPTDKDSGTIKAQLEHIFVPLEFQRIPEEGKQKRPADDSCSIGTVLTSGNRTAILAKPGGGKSTLIRRIALAYAYPERKEQVDDGLPAAQWFPVYIRCRDLGENVHRAITEIMYSVVNRAELSRYREAFEALIEEQLQLGQVLLLIDGLDEISNEQHRVRFVEQLQTFAKAHPKAHLLITSRETGFRAVAQNLSSYCGQYVIADLDEKRIRQLSENWHKALLDNPIQAKEDSDSVCQVILQDPRITALARNPLLLTTLLFVKRWIGYLPTKKCQLYQEMIKLLLVSWNAAAHLKMDMEETEPQLAFIAYRMTAEGRQTIRREELIQCVRDARRALPELLGYTKVTPSEFIDQVEERSSILIQQGLEEDERGNLVQSYEFSHLSFQEYLTAKAISENWLPENEKKDPVREYLSILKDHCRENQWWEVIPLTAVLLKRQARPAIEYLLEACRSPRQKDVSDSEKDKRSVEAFHLANCIACEVPLAEEILEPALLEIAIHSYGINNISHSHYAAQAGRRKNWSDADVFATIYHSEKYGKKLKSVVEHELLENKSSCSSGVANVWLKLHQEEKGEISLSEIQGLLGSGQRKKRIPGALLMMEFSFKSRRWLRDEKKWSGPQKGKALLRLNFPSILEMLQEEDPVECFAAAWCIAWSGYNEANIIPEEFYAEMADKLLHLWCVVDAPYDWKRFISWAVCTICRKDLKVEMTPRLAKAVQEHMERPENEYDEKSAFYLKLLCHEMTVEEFESMEASMEWRMIPDQFLKEMGVRSTKEYPAAYIGIESERKQSKR